MMVWYLSASSSLLLRDFACLGCSMYTFIIHLQAEWHQHYFQAFSSDAWRSSHLTMSFLKVDAQCTQPLKDSFCFHSNPRSHLSDAVFSNAAQVCAIIMYFFPLHVFSKGCRKHMALIDFLPRHICVSVQQFFLHVTFTCTQACVSCAHAHSSRSDTFLLPENDTPQGRVFSCTFSICHHLQHHVLNCLTFTITNH